MNIEKAIKQILFESELPEIWYHGTPLDFNEFSMDYFDSLDHETIDQEGPGLYFTSNYEDALGYSRKENSGYLWEVSLNFNKLVPLNKKPILKDCVQLIEWSEDYENKLLNWGHENINQNWMEVKKSLMREETAHKAFLSVWYDFYRYNSKDFCNNMRLLGYDGVIIPKSFGALHAVVYNPKIIQKISKTPV